MSFDLQVQNGDLVLNNGDLAIVQDTNKLIQDILKIALTTAGSNTLYPFYGSYLSRSIVGSVLDNQMTTQIAEAQIQNCLEILKTLQEQQVKSLQQVSANEQLGIILSVDVDQNVIEPTFYTVTIRVTSKGFQAVSTSFDVSPF